jgi:hypothetical protein
MSPTLSMSAPNRLLFASGNSVATATLKRLCGRRVKLRLTVCPVSKRSVTRASPV